MPTRGIGLSKRLFDNARARDARGAARAGGAAAGGRDPDRGLPRRSRRVPGEAGAAIQGPLEGARHGSRRHARSHQHAPDPPGRQRRPAADPVDRLLPPDPRHPAPALGGAVGRDRRARLDRQLVRDAVHGPLARRPAQLPRDVPALHDARPRLHAAGRRPLSGASPAREGTYPIDLEVDPPQRQNRWTVFFRGILAIPALLLSNILSQLNQLLAVFSWFIALVTGRVPEGLRNFAALAMRIETQTYAYGCC